MSSSSAQDGQRRPAHLVGSIPAPDASAAMAMAGQLLGDRLRWLPDGETGDRHHWVLGFIERLREHPDLEVVDDGDWSDYDSTPRFRVRSGHRLRASSLELGYLAAFEASLPSFERAQTASRDARLSFQVGIPSDLDLAMFVFGPQRALRHRSAFHDATVAELRRIHALGGGDVLFQIEAVLELVLSVRAPAPLRPVVARMMARPTARLAADAPAGARFGVHLCLGDMNHAPIVIPRDAAAVVALANAVAARWPAQRPLEFLHAPLAPADRAPSLDDAYYAPLSRLRLGPTRFVAGFAYEHQSLDEQEGVLAMIERAVGGPVGISPACGLGRRTQAEAQASMHRTRELCLTPAA